MNQNVYIKNKQLIKNKCFLNAEHILSLFYRQHSFHTHIANVNSTLTANVIYKRLCDRTQTTQQQYKQHVFLYKAVNQTENAYSHVFISVHSLIHNL